MCVIIVIFGEWLMQMHKDTHHRGKASIIAMADSGSKVVKWQQGLLMTMANRHHLVSSAP